MKTTQRASFREAGFNEAQTNAMAMALEPLATKSDLRDVATALRDEMGAFRDEMGALRDDMGTLRRDVEVLRTEVRWIKWIGGGIGVTVLAELVGGFFL